MYIDCVAMLFADLTELLLQDFVLVSYRIFQARIQLICSAISQLDIIQMTTVSSVYSLPSTSGSPVKHLNQLS